MTKLPPRARWQEVAEERFTRYVADYLGWMIEAWRYDEGPDSGRAYFRVSHSSLLTPIVGYCDNVRLAKAGAIETVLQRVAWDGRYANLEDSPNV